MKVFITHQIASTVLVIVLYSLALFLLPIEEKSELINTANIAVLIYTICTLLIGVVFAGDVETDILAPHFANLGVISIIALIAQFHILIIPAAAVGLLGAIAIADDSKISYATALVVFQMFLLLSYWLLIYNLKF